MQLEGRKKFTAYLGGLGTSIIGLLVTTGIVGEGAGDNLTTILVVMVPIGGAAIYDWLQSRHDIQKEVTKQEELKANVAYNEALATKVVPFMGAKELELIEPLDIKAFHEAVLANVGANYTEVNPATIFCQARDRGKVTDCQHISQAQDYWGYLTGLAYEAQAYIKDIVEKEKPVGGCKPRSPELYAFNRDLSQTLDMADNLDDLAESSIQWKGKLAPQHQTLYHLGAQAKELLEHNK